MNLTHILVFAAVGLLLGGGFALAIMRQGAGARLTALRQWAMLLLSVFALYWLQSSTPIRNLDFWLPSASLGLTVIVWAAINPLRRADLRATLTTLLGIAAVIVLVALTRYLPTLCCVTPSRPPDIVAVGLALLVILALAFAANLLFTRRPGLLTLAVLFILALFVILKLDALAREVSGGLRILTGQAADQAVGLDLRWLGFSYIAFRLIHVLRDRSTGKLAPNAFALREFVSYVVFFPALTAGPIDRAERFVKDARNPAAPQWADLAAGGQRILIGVFKKFVLADTLALVALNATNAAQAQAGMWMWVLVYAYALRIYFDFGGYTDIAIGLGRFFGIKLPENFDRPYLKPNLTMFWNSWHITLAQWFRTYFFNPLTRALRSPKDTPYLPATGFVRSPTFIILTGQIGTMLLIGLWHGITWNFVAWGVWHALGLFVHNRWADWMRRRSAQVSETPPAPSVWRQRVWNGISVALTFHFVALGWVWFALPSVELSLAVFRKLVGL
jgi:D-alanyl-lipoteichoic acid acyltransferase DltB (MBOAT superfamily)